MATPQGWPQPVLYELQQPDQTLSRKRAFEDPVKEARKERNRQHAKRCRERKKQEAAKLQQEADELRKENELLKQLIQKRVPENSAKEILGECSKLHQTDYQLIESLAATKQSFVITDPRLADNPIVYVSDKFVKLTGYPREQTIGRNCRFLQGPQTDPKAVEVVHNAIAKGVDCTTVLLNYKADGTPFWNRFFVAALRDWDGNITNYVGVQSKQEAPDSADKASEKEAASRSTQPTLVAPIEPTPTMVASSLEAERKRRKLDIDDGNEVLTDVDWSLLAEVLEDDFRDDLSFDSDYTSPMSSPVTLPVNTMPIAQPSNFMLSQPQQVQSNVGKSYEQLEYNDLSHLEQFVASPFDMTVRNVRSDLIESLMASDGNTSDPRFLSALSVLSSVYKSTGQDACKTNLHNASMTATWRSISSKNYGECLGRNECGNCMYTLGKMSFDMFKPGHLKCSVQRTLNHIAKVCRMDGAPSAAPWSLRRELAAWDQTEDSDRERDPAEMKHQQEQQSATMLKSYDIAVALTVESDDTSSAPPNGNQAQPLRLQALNVTHGYMLPDPQTPNRLTLWFTGGELSPAPSKRSDGSEEPYGCLEEWKALFGGNHKRTWGESLRVMGAKLLLGAQLPDSMEADGTMRYVLHRPVGGHGKTFVDVLYLDEYLIILQSSSGILHVMVRSHDGEESTPTDVHAEPKPESTSSEGLGPY